MWKLEASDRGVPINSPVKEVEVNKNKIEVNDVVSPCNCVPSNKKSHLTGTHIQGDEIVLTLTDVEDERLR